MLYNRISAFANLKISGLDRLSLQRNMDDIGKSGSDRLQPEIQRG